jgi:hypothetical protein
MIIFISSCSQPPSSKNIEVSVDVQQELFPVIAKFLSEGNKYSDITGLVKFRIKNTTNHSVQVSIISEIPEWTLPVITSINLLPDENKEIIQTPYGNRLLNNHSTVPASVMLKVKVDDKNIYEETKNLKIRSADDMVWSLYTPFDTDFLIAAWVTPNDEMVENILSNAKEKLLDNNLAGYNNTNVMSEIKAIFNAVRNDQVSYVNSSLSFGKVGFTQRVRLPRESLSQKSANCIDGAVLFASLFENIGLEPLLVLIPGHAFVGVRLAPNSRDVLFIETTLVGRNILNSVFTLTSTFDAATQKGNEEYNVAIQNNPSEVHIVDIKKARGLGIYPLL